MLKPDITERDTDGWIVMVNAVPGPSLDTDSAASLSAQPARCALVYVI
jgi:hypothetical protein